MISATRFAPSPTGRLHLGHAFSALLAHDLARAHHGAFELRIEDIDGDRSRPEFIDGIFEDLAWLRLEWDGTILYQSERMACYAEALDRLKQLGLVYPCFCTRSAIAAEVAASAAAPHGPYGSVYPGTCRSLSAHERDRRTAHESHAWRLDTAAAYRQTGPLTWREGDREIGIDPTSHGDVVLARREVPASYHLAVVVDDAFQEISDVVRGRDLFAATDIHCLLQALLGLPTPNYHHHDLLAGSDGRRLAKRYGAPTLADLRDAGTDPADLVDRLRSGRLPAGYSPAAV